MALYKIDFDTKYKVLTSVNFVTKLSNTGLKFLTYLAVVTAHLAVVTDLSFTRDYR